MELFIRGKGQVRLDQGNFIGQGGEATLYAKGDLAFKIYTDPNKVVPPAKVQELAALTHPNIIVPRDVLLDKKNRPVGYTMPYVQRAEPLCRLFTRAFRERKNITPAAVLQLVRQFQETVQFVHKQGVLIVDLNEMNFLLDMTFQVILFIDVDSYKTPSFPPTAIMDSIRDRHAAQFSEMTDWFSFAIVSFQMFIGIHPFKGKHATLSTLDSRMSQNVSVLNSSVSIPAACYAFDTIPPAYLDWYRAVFEQGVRAAPPDKLTSILRVQPQKVTRLDGDKLILDKIRTFPADIVFAALEIGPEIALTADGLYLRDRKMLSNGEVRLVSTPRLQHTIAVGQETGQLRLWDITTGKELVSTQICADGFTTYQNRIYLKNGEGIFELVWLELPAGLQATVKQVGNVLAFASKVYDGVVVQNLLGTYHVILFPESGVAYNVRLPELNEYLIVEAKFDRGVLMLLAGKQGRYDRFVLRFNAQCDTYDVRVVSDVLCTAPNFITLARGVCLHLNENNELDIFSSRPATGDTRVLNETALQGAQLYRTETEAFFARGDSLYRMRLRT